jgi:hypothetical protein
LNKLLPQKRTQGPPEIKSNVEKHTYLRVGDKVYHKKFKSWGGGIVIETWSSDLPGDFVMFNLFQDGKKRVFDNSFDSALLLSRRDHTSQSHCFVKLLSKSESASFIGP